MCAAGRTRRVWMGATTQTGDWAGAGFGPDSGLGHRVGLNFLFFLFTDFGGFVSDNGLLRSGFDPFGFGGG